MLMLAVIQSVMRQDIGLLVRSAFGYLPMAFVLAGVAIAATGLLVAITDDISSAVVSGLGTEQSDNLLQSVGDAYKNALDEESGIPLFGVFPGRDHPGDRSLRALVGADHPRRDLRLRVLPTAYIRGDDLACNEPLGEAARRAAHCDHPRQVRHRRDPQSLQARRSPTQPSLPARETRSSG